jgi:hypothetical protein
MTEHLEDSVELSALRSLTDGAEWMVTLLTHTEESMIYELAPLPVDCTEENFSRIVRDVAKLEHDCKLWLADASLLAQNRWGARGLEIMSRATNLKVCSLKHASYTAKAFPPEKRFDYNYNSLRFMKPYANANADWTDAFLAKHQADKLSSRDLRALAQKEYAVRDGKDKKPVVKCRSPKKCSVNIRTELYARLRLHNTDGPISVMIDRILEDWLKQQPEVTAVIVPVPEPEPKPTYAERRKKQIADGAKKITPKPARKMTGKLHRQWIECKGAEFLDGEGGAVKVSDVKHDATKFYNEAAAIAAEADFFKANGFREDVVHCDVCSKRSRRDVWHVRHRFASKAASLMQEKPADVLAG